MIKTKNKKNTEKIIKEGKMEYKSIKLPKKYKQPIRILGYPTAHGGVEYFLSFYNRAQIILEIGADDLGENIFEKYSIREFLESVKEQHDYNKIKECIKKRKENVLQTKTREKQPLAIEC